LGVVHGADENESKNQSWFCTGNYFITGGKRGEKVLILLDVHSILRGEEIQNIELKEEDDEKY
jgi:hypothetical protein